jgi:hypothetical protein
MLTSDHCELCPAQDGIGIEIRGLEFLFELLSSREGPLYPRLRWLCHDFGDCCGVVVVIAVVVVTAH